MRSRDDRVFSNDVLRAARTELGIEDRRYSVYKKAACVDTSRARFS